MSKLHYLAAASLLASCGYQPAYCADNMTIAEEAVYQIAALGDLSTTLDIRRHPGMFEYNPILGRHPTDASVYRYFAICDASHILVTYALRESGHERAANYWEYGTISLELGMIGHNYSIGLRGKF